MTHPDSNELIRYARYDLELSSRYDEWRPQRSA
jgi:hypothetical protein